MTRTIQAYYDATIGLPYCPRCAEDLYGPDRMDVLDPLTADDILADPQVRCSACLRALRGEGESES